MDATDADCTRTKCMSTEMSPEPGERLRQERERLGLSQSTLAEKLGVHRNTVVRYEAGKREPAVEYLSALAELGADFGFLLSGERTTANSAYSLAAALVLPAVADRAGLSAGALLGILDLAAEDEAHKWGPGGDAQPPGENPRLTELIDALFENGPLLENVFHEVARVQHVRSTRLSYGKRAKVVSMLYRSSRGSGQIDPQMVIEAVTLAAD